MTNEEIEKTADSLLDSLIESGCIPDIDPAKDPEALRLATADMRLLVSRAYEEAARELSTAVDTLPPDGHYGQADSVPSVAYELGRKDGLRDAATKVRVLKDSLLQETVST